MNALFQTPRALHRHYLGRLAALALVVGVGFGAAASVFAHGPATMAWHHGSSEDVGNHVTQMVQQLYADVDVSDAQKAQIDPLVQQAIADLAPLHSEIHDSHADMLAVLGAETVDRAAIETMRVSHIRAMDQASQRITQLIEDIADVLTPAQRKALAAEIAQHHAAQQ